MSGEAKVTLVGRSFPVLAVVGFIMGTATIVYQAGLLSQKVEAASTQTAQNTADITQLKSDLADIRRGQAEIGKNVDRILNKLDTLVNRK